MVDFLTTLILRFFGFMGIMGKQIPKLRERPKNNNLATHEKARRKLDP